MIFSKSVQLKGMKLLSVWKYHANRHFIRVIKKHNSTCFVLCVYIAFVFVFAFILLIPGVM